MAVDAITKREFNDKIKDHKKSLAEIDKDIAAYKKSLTTNEKLKPFLYLGTTAAYLKQANINMDMSYLSEKMLAVKNQSYLDQARKLLLRIFPEMEKVVTLETDEPLDFNREKLDLIKPFTPKHRLNLIKHLQKSVKRMIDSYGPNTKWKWSFPDIWSKIAIVAKNLIDYREVQSIRDPREQFYYDRQELLTIIKEALFDASNQFRDKFELSTKSNNDLLLAVKLLEDLRRICSMMGDTEQAKKAKAGIESYRARLEAIAAEEEAKKTGVAVKKKKK